ncbi:MAG: L-aspartate oxidase [Treponema sp.]|mgnify:CR=1 FL=1|nr:MAG: L-aspartate oxidase [Treponema sp.]
MRTRTGVLVIGTGIAGLTAAITALERGLSVIVVTKEDRVEECATNYAQGGIIASKPGDSADALARDIMEAGCFYNNEDAVELFASGAPRLVFDILAGKAHVDFSKSNTSYDYTGEAAHSTKRIVHFEDHTGDAIEAALAAYARSLGADIRTGHTAVDLITNNHHSADPRELYLPREVFGAYVLENATGCVHTIFADAVILACGGVGNVYQFTTNPPAATGDGIAMAWRAGADVINAEFVQFHPTALFHKDIKRFLISESLRGEGAVLVDRNGRAFMHTYTPQKELAPRDIVTRAIYEEMAEQGVDHLFLDIASHYKGEVPIKERFSRIYATCLSGGIDITREPIPIVPAAHYFCGGVKVDLSGRTSIRRLFAVGETACTGIHGANRLASTSLLEGLFWGKRAAEACSAASQEAPASNGACGAECAQPVSGERFDRILDWEKPANPERFEPSLMYQDWNMIKLTMWNHAGIVRTRKGLQRAEADLNYHEHRINRFYHEACLTRDIIELRNGVTAARLIVGAAMHNRKSIGCHFRLD